MRKSRFTETQIVAILKESEGGLPVADICRSHGISQATFYKWRSKYGGMDASLVKRLTRIPHEIEDGGGSPRS
jgi:putative transposase